MKKYFLPFTLGVAAMFVAHILLFILSTGFRLNYMPYVIAYPIVYISLSFILVRYKPSWWLSNSILIFLAPFFYWYMLLWQDGKFTLEDAINVKDSSGMILILPFTFIVAVFISFMYFKRQQVQNIH